MGTASSRVKVSDTEIDPVVGRAIIDPKEVDGETVPGLDPFVAYEHAYRRQKKGENLDYDVTDDGGIQVFYNSEFPEEDPRYQQWGFSIRVEVMNDNSSYVEVRYSPKVEDHNNGQRIWENIVDTLEDRTVEYHRDIKGELHD